MNLSDSKKQSESSVPSAKIAAIRSFIEAGYTLIPLRGKIPTSKDWVNTAPGTFTEKELAGGNYGVALKAGDLVVDIDPRNFPNGRHPLSELVSTIKTPLASFTVRTGGGGLHVYFRKPVDFQTASMLKEFPGIEFKSAGRQVVGPGSVHPDSGKTYEIAVGTPSEIKDAPQALLDLIKRSTVPFGEADGGAKGLTEYKNDAGTQGRFIGFLQDAADVAVQGQNGDAVTYKVSCYGRDLGLPPALTWELMLEFWNKRCVPPWDHEDLKAKVIHAYRYARGPVGSAHPAADFTEVKNEGREKDEIAWVLTKQGAIVTCFYNLLNYLRLPSGGLHKVFGYNEFTGEVEFTNPAPWHFGKLPTYPSVSDNDLKLLKGYLAVKHSFEMPVTNIEEAVTVTAQSNRFHPVREYLEGVKWDGQPRIDMWLSTYLGVEDSEYVQACARKALCAAVMRVMRPGCKFDHVLVLEGDQGIGKSTVCRILGGKWSGDFSVDPHNKDTIQLMQGKWVVECAELEMTRKADMDALKAFLTRQSDKVRLAYGRLAREFPRQSIFIASKNPGPEGTYLKDDTGNRRWWPVACNPPSGQIDFAGLKSVRDQLWAEAMHVVKNKGEHLYMETAELKEKAAESAAARYAEHEWMERIAMWVSEFERGGAETDREFLTAREVYIDAMGGMDKQFERRSAIAIARCLRDLGWEPAFRRVDGRLVRGYSRKMVRVFLKKEDRNLLEGLI